MVFFGKQTCVMRLIARDYNTVCPKSYSENLLGRIEVKYQ